MTPTELILPLPRMARRIGVTQKWLKAEAEAGRIPCVRAERRYLFSPLAVEEKLAALASQGTGHV